MGRGAKRKKSKYPGLDKAVNSKFRQDLIDHDYIEQLNHDEKEWLSNFNEEYISGNFKHNGEIMHTEVQEKRDCYNRNNARNRCIFTRTKAMWMLDHINEAMESDKNLDEEIELGFIMNELINRDINIKKFLKFITENEFEENWSLEEYIFLFDNSKK